jgi:sporulation protein YlmC with PRC-barrel domain
MKAEPLDLVRDLIDRQLIDVDGEPCGMVDEVELAIENGGWRVVGLRVGVGAWAPRLPALLQPLARAAFGQRTVRVAWSDITTIRESVRLARPAAELGLRFVDPRLQRLLERIPGHDKTESA